MSTNSSKGLPHGIIIDLHLTSHILDGALKSLLTLRATVDEFNQPNAECEALGAAMSVIESQIERIDATADKLWEYNPYEGWVGK